MTENSAQKASPSFMETWKATRRKELPLQDPVQSALQIALSVSFAASNAASLVRGYSVRYGPGVVPLTKPYTVARSVATVVHTCSVVSGAMALRSRLQLEGEGKRGFAARESLNLVGTTTVNTVIATLYGLEAATGHSMGKRPLSVLGRAQSGLYALQASHVVVSATRELYARREVLSTEFQMAAIVFKENIKALKDELLIKAGIKTDEEVLLDAIADSLLSGLRQQNAK